MSLTIDRGEKGQCQQLVSGDPTRERGGEAKPPARPSPGLRLRSHPAPRSGPRPRRALPPVCCHARQEQKKREIKKKRPQTIQKLALEQKVRGWFLHPLTDWSVISWTGHFLSPFLRAWGSSQRRPLLPARSPSFFTYSGAAREGWKTAEPTLGSLNPLGKLDPAVTPGLGGRGVLHHPCAWHLERGAGSPRGAKARGASAPLREGRRGHGFTPHGSVVSWGLASSDLNLNNDLGQWAPDGKRREGQDFSEAKQKGTTLLAVPRAAATLLRPRLSGRC